MVDLKAKPFYLKDDEITWVEDTIASMTLDEKLSQLFVLLKSVPGADEEGIRKLMETSKPGGMRWQGGDKETVARQNRLFQQFSRIPLFIAGNCDDGGNGVLPKEGTFVATAAEAGASEGTETAYNIGYVSGREASAVGVNWMFNPVADVYMNWRNTIVNTRSFGSDPARVTECVCAYIKGIKDAAPDMACTLKHFPGDGWDELDPHISPAFNGCSVDEWMESYGAVYRAVIDDGLEAVIPYGSMASAITADPKQRAELSTWRTLGATMAATACGVVLPMVIYYTDAEGHTALNGSKLSIAAVVCSVLAVICYILCYALTTERVKLETTTGKFDLAELGKSLVTNRSLIGIVVAALVFLLAQLSLSGMLSYIMPNYFGSGAGQSISNLVGTAVTLICSVFAVRLSTKVGKKELGIGASVLGAVVLIAAFITHTENLRTFLVFYALAYIALAIFNLIIWAMITDVIDDTEVRTGKRQDGTIYSIYSFARKLGQAASSGLTGLLLSLIGYTAETAFEPSVVNGIYNITCIAPAIGFILLALALTFIYPLSKSVVESNAKILAERRAENQK